MLYDYVCMYVYICVYIYIYIYILLSYNIILAGFFGKAPPSISTCFHHFLFEVILSNLNIMPAQLSEVTPQYYMIQEPLGVISWTQLQYSLNIKYRGLLDLCA